MWVQFLGWDDPLKRKWQPSPIVLHGKSHGQRSLAGYSPKCHKELDTTEPLSTYNAYLYETDSMRPALPWYQNQAKISHKKENYRSISLMTVDAKTHKKILANWIQQYIKRIIHHNQMKFIAEIWGIFNILKSVNVINYINELENKNQVIISTDAEKTLLDFNILSWKKKKTFHKVGIKWTHVN